MTRPLPTGSFSVGLVDNDPLALKAIECTIREGLPRAEVIWATGDGFAAVRYATQAETQPDVAVVDMSMETVTGLAVCRRIRRDNDVVRLLAITSFSLNVYAEDAGRAGAQGIVGKGDGDELLVALDAVAQGHTYGDGGFEPASMAHYRLLHSESESVDVLTPREIEVMNLVSEGLGDDDVAHRLGMGRDTVRKHMQAAMRKLNVRNRVQAVLRWLGSERHGRRFSL